MKVSLNTIKQLIDFELPPVDELVKRINEQLGGVEEIIDLRKKYEGAIIVKVISAVQHPNADRLRVCMVDDGGIVKDVERDEQGHVQVVCGAPNAVAGMLAVWLPPNTTVPASFETDEPFVLGARELRGVKSNGMLAASDELAIGTDHEGIIELTADEWNPNGVEIKPGVSFAAAFGLNDVIIDIENKMFTHRPDCFGQIGVAREIAGILGHQFTSPDWYVKAPEFASANGLELTVVNDAPEHVSRLMAVAIKDIEIKPSPMWLQCELVRLGGKPINNIVDVTNYVMLLTAQPTHAYDYDKLRGHKLGARMATDGEQIHLLNDKSYTLTSDDIVIVDGEGPVGLAGIMGGGDSEVDANTKNIVLEVADFDMYAVRKTSMRNGVFTDALTRFNKGQSPLQQQHVMNLLMMSINDVAGGGQASDVFGQQDNTKQPAVSVSVSFINDRLGSNLQTGEIKTLLQNVEIDVAGDDELTVTPPFWRTDIELPEDVVEEVGRLYGFEKLPRELPLRSSAPAAKNGMRELKQRIRTGLSRAGGNETLTYSFVHENVLKRAGQDASQAFKLGNALSPDLQYFRLSVLPSLLDKVHMNIKQGHDEFMLFEIGRAHNKKDHAADDVDGLPREIEMCDAIYASKQSKAGAPYYYMRHVVTQLVKDLGFTLRFTPITSTVDTQIAAPFEMGRSAIIESRQGELIGIVGELKQSVRKGFKLPDYAAAMSLDVEGLQKAAAIDRQQYVPLSRYPSTSQDISLKTNNDITYEQLFHAVWNAISEKADGMDVKIEPVSIYQAEGDSETKTTTLHITFTHYEHTLTDTDISPVMAYVAAQAAAQLNAERV